MEPGTHTTDARSTTMATVPERGLSNVEFARRGDDMYERHVLPNVGLDDEGKFVVVDIETVDFEVDTSDVAASDRLLARRPAAKMWLRQVGSRYAYRFGFHRTMITP
jgi:hypothetical protein